MISQIITNIQRFNVTEFRKLSEDIFVEIFEVLLDLTRIDWLTVWIDAGGDDVGTLVHVGEEESWGDCGTVVETRATVAVTTRADLEVERAVYSVFFCAED